jgi:hypothetical protein
MTFACLLNMLATFQEDAGYSELDEGIARFPLSVKAVDLFE